MLGVLKRRWKPKRSANPSRLPGTDTSSLEGSEKDREKPPKLGPASIRQVHPVYDDKAQICYEKHSLSSRHPSLGDLNSSPPPYPKRASLESNHSPTQLYPLTPNICVEAGRIQFIKQDTEGGGGQEHAATEGNDLAKTPSMARSSRITVTRGSQTDEDERLQSEEIKAEVVIHSKDITVPKIAFSEKSLENRITELEAALDAAQKNELRDKQHIAKLQKQISRRESAQRDADRERRLRVDSETRAKQALQEAARARSRLKLLTNEFARMEDTVRSMLVYKKQAEQLRQEKAALTLAFENRCQQYQSTINRLNQEVSTLRQQLEQVGLDSNPEGILQAHAAALQRHAEESRKQYERCLDDVANQVVRALLAQKIKNIILSLNTVNIDAELFNMKGLREEVGTLNNRILELETQNRALTQMLMHQLRGESSQSTPELDTTTSEQLALEETSKEDQNHSDSSQNDTLETSLAVKHSNSFNSEVLEDSPKENAESTNISGALLKIRKRLSADSEIIDTRLSLEDKKRHQVLTRLWTELKGSEVTPKKLLEALTAVDSALWVPPQRPVSLNLQLPLLQATKYRKSRSIQAQSSVKSEEETTGNDSPESGNRDEGYSTMSSDVQADMTRSSGDTTTNRELEDLKEASDETDIQETKLLVTDTKDPDILYIPLNLLNLKPRNSYPPAKDMLPFQHIMRSFSDSHLCIKITTAPSPCYTFSSPISSSPSIFLLDITEKSVNQLKRTKGTNTLWGNVNSEHSEDKTSQHSWSSAVDDRLECTTWDAEYIQHWLRLDETRSVLQQQHRDMLELEYDRAELEDWSLSLSNDDLREQWKRLDATTPGQISISTLPSIQENNTLELEEDSNECLWNSSSYMMDKEGRELVTLLMDPASSFNERPWPYAISATVAQASPDNSWSSGGSDCCHSHEPETCSKRSSAALSGCSDDTSELPAIGTDFTRDFYRLVKFESTKSLASTSSRALSENGDRETTLQNVLTFIAEQQKYVNSREATKDSHICSLDDITKEFNIEGPPQNLEDLKICDSDLCLDKSESKSSDNENSVILKQLPEESTLNEQNNDNENTSNNIDENIKQNIAYANEVCLVTPLDFESESCSNITEVPVDICSSINVEITSTDYQMVVFSEEKPKNDSPSPDDINNSDLIKSSDTTSSDISTSNGGLSESVTSSVSTPETVVSRIPRRKTTPSRIPVSPAKSNNNNNCQNERDNKLPKSKIPHKSKPKANQKQKVVHVQQNNEPQHVITSERLPQSSAGVISNIIDGPPHRAVSFHERATSKDVIDELNRMIKNGEDNSANQDNATAESNNQKLDQACRPTGWIHVERDIDLGDPKARANLLDVMMASVSSDSSPTSSCGGSVASDSTEDPPDYNHLHRIHRYHRQKKACAVRPEMAVVRASQLPPRPTIIGRPDFFVRYGEKEREAVASFDFLDELSTTSSSLSCSIEETIEQDEYFDSEIKCGRLKVSQV